MSARRKPETDEQEPTVADVAAAREQMEAPVEGGRYEMPDGRIVNANGDEITKSGKVKDTDD